MLRYTLLRTALSPLLAVADDRGICRLEFLPRAYLAPTRAHAVATALGETDPPREDPAAFTALRRRLAAYMAGEGDLSGLPLSLHGTPFQRRVWRHVRTLAPGQLSTYRRVARAVGEPLATRAVGRALAANPLPLLVPCHRVIGSDGRLTGYAGGLALKAQLLRLEGHDVDGDRLIPPQLF